MGGIGNYARLGGRWRRNTCIKGEEDSKRAARCQDQRPIERLVAGSPCVSHATDSTAWRLCHPQQPGRRKWRIRSCENRSVSDNPSPEHRLGLRHANADDAQASLKIEPQPPYCPRFYQVSGPTTMQHAVVLRIVCIVLTSCLLSQPYLHEHCASS